MSPKCFEQCQMAIVVLVAACRILPGACSPVHFHAELLAKMFQFEKFIFRQQQASMGLNDVIPVTQSKIYVQFDYAYNHAASICALVVLSIPPTHGAR